MKIVTIFQLTSFLTISSSSRSRKLAPNVNNCTLLLPVEVKSQTIFIDMDHNTDLELKSCVLKNSHSEQTVHLINVNGRKKIIQAAVDEDNTRHKIRTNENPNIIIMTEYLYRNITDSPLFEYFINSPWSLLYIVCTSVDKFKCDNGTMNTNDFILLDKIMNNLWHKYKVVYVGIVFPFACIQKMMIYNGKRFVTNQTIFDRSITMIDVTNSEDLYGAILRSGNSISEHYPLRGNMFYRYPTSIRSCEKLRYYRRFNLSLTMGFCGLDGMVMHDILSHFKFALNYVHDDSCIDYGYEYPGNVTGSLGCITRKELDISFNSRFMTAYSSSSNNVYFMHHVTTDALCALVKKSDVIPIWHGSINVFKGEIWLIVITLVVAIGVIMWATAIISETMTGEKSMKLWCYLHEALTTTFFGYLVRRKGSFLLLKGTCLVSSVLFTAMYQSHINHAYTTLERFSRIEKLEQLFKSGTTLYTSQSTKNLVKTLLNLDDNLQWDFYNRISTGMGGNSTGTVLQIPGSITLGRKSDALMEISTLYSDEFGRPMIDIVDECFYIYYLAYIARAGFPFFEDLQIFLQRISEAGLPKVYYRWTQRTLGLPDLIPQYHSEPRPYTDTSLGDLRIPFGILFIGYFISLVVFIVESWRGRNLSSLEDI